MASKKFTSTTDTTAPSPAVTARSAANEARRHLESLRSELAAAEAAIVEARDATAEAKAKAAATRGEGPDPFRVAVAAAVAAEIREREAVLARDIVRDATVAAEGECARLDRAARLEEARERYPFAFADLANAAIVARMPRLESLYRELAALHREFGTIVEQSAAGVATLSAADTPGAMSLPVERLELAEVYRRAQTRIRELRVNDPELRIATSTGLSLGGGEIMRRGDAIASGVHRLVLDGHVLPNAAFEAQETTRRVSHVTPDAGPAATLLTID